MNYLDLKLDRLVSTTVKVAPSMKDLASMDPDSAVESIEKKVIGRIVAVDPASGCATVFWESGETRVHRPEDLSEYVP